MNYYTHTHTCIHILTPTHLWLTDLVNRLAPLLDYKVYEVSSSYLLFITVSLAPRTVSAE